MHQLWNKLRDFLETTRNAFFIGRTIDYNVSLEGALKLKEISYIQAEGFAGGELKHGTIALIEEGTPVVGLATQRKLIYQFVVTLKSSSTWCTSMYYFYGGS